VRVVAHASPQHAPSSASAPKRAGTPRRAATAGDRAAGPAPCYSLDGILERILVS